MHAKRLLWVVCLPSLVLIAHGIFSARCNIYIWRLCYDVSVRLSVRLSVTEVHWRIIANLDVADGANCIYGSTHLISAYYTFIDPERIKG